MSDFLQIARDLAARPGQWPVAVRFDPVQRWYHRLALHDDYEAWLLSWLPGQETDLHDHGGSAGAFTVVSGELTEHTVTGGDGAARLAGTALTAGDGRRFGAHHLHQIANNGTVPAVSVHVYGPALRTMTRYRLHDGRLRVAAVDRAGAQW
ncbi:cysteine dioxygenase family protein [Catellatospora sp. TT07R-123]|uniref:cysteine dioxygenase n=1 Tax=Catellatospora sp. TT07R-123 TaxID=2733863 RepID=UPI001FD46A28|nr:cysteine dioxygenase family protein [Catellatospora sp. TT07R-123]